MTSRTHPWPSIATPSASRSATTSDTAGSAGSRAAPAGDPARPPALPPPAPAPAPPPPGLGPGPVTDDERRTIIEMMAKGSYAALILATADLEGTFARLQARG